MLFRKRRGDLIRNQIGRMEVRASTHSASKLGALTGKENCQTDVGRRGRGAHTFQGCTWLDRRGEGEEVWDGRVGGASEDMDLEGELI